ncbi:MAG: D-alanine--D-alanine ligase [Firmicutes bacterium]|nr:D-alanine--D-alanine ligase [Bacillota bacterium]
MNRIRLGILFGGTSIENEISERSCKNILKYLDDEKYDITLYKLPKTGDRGWIKEFVNNPPDVVLSALHGGRGENGTIQGFLHTLGIPYVGSKVLSSALCMDKFMAKTVLKSEKIQVPDGIIIRRGENISSFEAQINELRFPLIVKPNRGGSSIGLTLVDNMDALKEALSSAMANYDDDILIEKFIEGNEVSCCVYEDENGINILSLLDINKKGMLFEYDDKYSSQSSIADISSLNTYIKQTLENIAFKTFKSLKCKGYACVDMIVQDERIYVLEVNTLPGLTEKSLIPCATTQTPFSFGEFLDKIISHELKEYHKK